METNHINKKNLWRIFKRFFKIVACKNFEETEESLKNISALFFYFLKNEDFLNHPNVRADLSKPNFDKGILIIGGYGVGKTNCMKALELSFKYLKTNRFKIYSTNEVVQNFEICSTPYDKENFYHRMNLGADLYDDLTTEKLASNFGHINIMKEILEERYNRKKLTHAITNFKDGYDNDVEAALEHLGEVYGSRFYDRIFDMFNIVVFTGKSYRR